MEEKKNQNRKRESRKNAGKRQQQFNWFENFQSFFLYLIEKLCSAHSFAFFFFVMDILFTLRNSNKWAIRDFIIY